MKQETNRAVIYSWDDERVPQQIRDQANVYLERAHKLHPQARISFQYFKASKDITYGNLSYMRFGLKETADGREYTWRYWAPIHGTRKGAFTPGAWVDKLHSDGASRKLDEAVFPPGTGVVRLLGHPTLGYKISTMRSIEHPKTVKLFGANQWRTDSEVLKQWQYVKELAATYQTEAQS